MRNARQASRDMDLLSRNVWRTKEQNYVTGLSGQEPRVNLELSIIVSPRSEHLTLDQRTPNVQKFGPF